MKIILYINTIASMFTMLLVLWSFGHGQITEYQFLALTVFCAFIGVFSLYGAETTND